MTFPEFLEHKFLAWQTEQGRRKTIQDFASYLGVKQPVLSSWLNGTRTPNTESARLLASKLGFEIYDVLGEKRPDPDLFHLVQNWDGYNPTERRAILEIVEQIEADKHAQRLSKKRRTRTSS